MIPDVSGRGFVVMGSSAVAITIRSRLRVFVTLAFLVALAVLVVSSPPAFAGVTHPFVGSFGPGGPGVGVFVDVEGVAVDQASGDVYVLDAGQGKLYRFDSEGKPELFVAGTHCTVEEVEVPNCIEGVGGRGGAEDELAVDSSSGPAKGDIYVANGGNVGIYGPNGSSLGAIEEEGGHPWGEPCGVAADPSGEVYVGLWPEHVNKYKPVGEPGHVEYTTSLAGLSGVCNVAVDSLGNVFADTYTGGPVTSYAESQFGPGPATGSVVDAAGFTLTVDPASDNVYVNEGNRVSEYGPHGEPFKEPVGVSGVSGEGAISGSFGVAVNGSSGRLYAASGAGTVNIYGPAVEVPAPVVTIDPPSNITSSSATFTGTVNPNGTDPLEDASWHFEYSIDNEQTWTSTPGGDAGTGTSPVNVEDQVTGFLPDQEVKVRLVGTNAANTVTSEVVSFITVTLVPDATTEQAQDITPDHAALAATLNAHNAPTTYFFQYGTTTAYGTSIPAGQDGDGGSSAVTTAATQVVYGLTPGTTYHYRVVVHNTAGTSHGQDQTFTTTTALPASIVREGIPGAGFLPDNRGWEQASPTTKHGSDVLIDSARTRAATTDTPSDPMAATFSSLGAFADVHGTNIANDYITIRTGQPATSGWATHGITPPQQPLTFPAALQGFESAWQGDFSPDLSRGVFRSWTALTDDPNVSDVENLYRRDDLRTPGPGSYQLLSGCPLCTTPLPPIASGTQLSWLAGASSDFGHVIFESTYPLVNGSTASGENPNLYEWDHGTLRLAGILPDSACGTPPCVAPRSLAGVGTGAGSGSGLRLSPHTISTDGARIIFTDTSTSTIPFSGNLYMRINGTSTIQLNASEKTSPDPAQPAKFQTASSDGTRVFFTTGEQLTDTPTTGNDDLYMYDTSAPANHHLTLISIGHSTEDTPLGVKGVIGASNDGHYVYFFAAGQLVAGQPVLGADFGVYEWHDGVNSFISRLTGGGERFDALPNFWGAGPITARVTPDGKHMLFQSNTGLGGYDSNGHRELYLYNGETHELQCASCRPDGTPAGGDAGDMSRNFEGGTGTASHLSRAVSDDGSRVFFTTTDRLLPQDTNNKSDVYEFDSASGTVHLLSGGTDNADSFFMDASANGDDVFFLTRQQLVGWDTDQNYDLYDARVNGGLPEPPLTTRCSGEACAGEAPLAVGAPSPESGSGPGNLPLPASAPPKTKVKPLTNAQKLAKALKACRSQHNRRKRSACERAARRHYGPKKAKGKRAASNGRVR